MNIHEYQAKEVLRAFGAPVPRGKAAFTVEEAVAAAKELPGPVWVVKAQIHAGGRGKGGGVKVVRSIEDVRKEAERMLGMTLVTHQTGPHGRVVRRLYIEDGSAIERELYLSALVDRGASRVAFIASTEGGMDIEEVAHKTPEKILTFSIDPASGYSPHVGRGFANVLKLTGDAAKQAGALIESLYRAFIAKDMSLLEVNPRGPFRNSTRHGVVNTANEQAILAHVNFTAQLSQLHKLTAGCICSVAADSTQANRIVINPSDEPGAICGSVAFDPGNPHLLARFQTMSRYRDHHLRIIRRPGDGFWSRCGQRHRTTQIKLTNFLTHDPALPVGNGIAGCVASHDLVRHPIHSRTQVRLITQEDFKRTSPVDTGPRDGRLIAVHLTSRHRQSGSRLQQHFNRTTPVRAGLISKIGSHPDATGTQLIIR